MMQRGTVSIPRNNFEVLAETLLGVTDPDRKRIPGIKWSNVQLKALPFDVWILSYTRAPTGLCSQGKHDAISNVKKLQPIAYWRMASSGMLRRVALVRTEVSVEPGTSFIRVTKIGELGTLQAATSNRRTLRRNTYFFAARRHHSWKCFVIKEMKYIVRVIVIMQWVWISGH
jgi:hypothetical protein